MEIVAEEVALSEFARMCAAQHIDMDESKMSTEELEDFSDKRSRVVAAMQDGRLVVSEAGQPTYAPITQGAKPFVFHRATGATFIAMDAAKQEASITRVVLAAQELTKSAPGSIAKLDLVDFRLITTITNLFLAAG